MKRNMLIGLWAAVALLAGVTCAPLDRPARDGDASNKGTEPEVVKIRPKVVEDPTRARIEAAIQNVRERDLHTDNAFWAIFHGILGLGPSLTLKDPQTGEKINAVEHICSGNHLRGLRFLPTRWGVDVENWTDGQGVGQGHQDQFIAEMAQWGMKPDQRFVVFGRDYTFMDFVRHSQMRARVTQNQELSWTIIIIAQYLGTDLTWTNGYGEKLTFEDIVRYELDASVENAACGGTHRLFGLSWALHLHMRKGGGRTGVWQEIHDKTIKYRDIAKKMQNPDGSFSTGYFKSPGDASDKQLRLHSTGHILEWLALALPDSELRKPWMQDAANALALMILEQQGAAIESGSLYHAVHGLLMYYARVYDPKWLGPNEPYMVLPPKW
jgi:hypothetical protein